MTNAKTNFFTDVKKNVLAIAVFVLFFLLISPLFPGVAWFKLGDFNLDTVNYYHTIMIPLALILILVTANVFGPSSSIKKFITITTFPVLLFSFLGLVLFYPSSAVTADAAAQAIRDILMVLDAILLIILLIIFPFRSRAQFKSMYGGYFLVLLAAISAGIAAVFGMVLEYGNLYGFTAIGPFNSFVISVGGLDTFLGNAWTLHSHQMLPAVMGGIVGLTAVVLGYNKLSKTLRGVVNLGMLVSCFGVISMSVFYWISTMGTYVIPAIFTSAQGVNGLALDDSQTGIIGIGAMIAVVGLVKAVDTARGRKLIQLTSLGTWITAVATMIGVGFVIEFNEVFYGFADPTSGSAGYSYDMAYTDGHLMLAFFFLVVLAGMLVATYHFNKGDSKYFRATSAVAIAGMAIAFEGLLVYVMTLNWVVEAVGIWLIFISMVISVLPYFGKTENINPQPQ